MDIEIGSAVDLQCVDFFGFNISDTTFIGQLDLFCDSDVTPAPTSSPTLLTPTQFLNCGDTIIGDTSLPGNFEDRFLFRLDFAGTITFSSCGSSYDTLATIYDINGNQIVRRYVLLIFNNNVYRNNINLVMMVLDVLYLLILILILHQMLVKPIYLVFLGLQASLVIIH